MTQQNLMTQQKMDQLWKAYRLSILLVLKRKYPTHNLEDLESLLGISFMDAVRYFEQVTPALPDDKFPAFWRQTIGSDVIDEWRKTGRWPVLSLSDDVIANLGNGPRLENHTLLIIALQECLSKLTPEEQELAKTYIEGMTISQIAEALGRNYQHIRYRLDTAKNALKQCLGRKGFDPQK